MLHWRLHFSMSLATRDWPCYQYLASGMWMEKWASTFFLPHLTGRQRFGWVPKKEDKQRERQPISLWTSNWSRTQLLPYESYVPYNLLYSHKKEGNNAIFFAATWTNLGIIVLNEVCQTETNILWYHLYMESKKMIQMKLYTKQQQTHRQTTNLRLSRGKVGEG